MSSHGAEGGASWARAGEWDLSQRPVLLAGAYGHAYETRPTTSLARDLAEDELNHPPLAEALSQPRRQSNPMDDRPIRPAPQSWTLDDNTRSQPSQISGSSSPSFRGSPSRSSADRPMERAPRARVSVGGLAGSVSSPSARQSNGVRSPNAASSKSPKFFERRDSGAQSRYYLPSNSGKPYSPADVLVNMGFEEELARVALAAVGGDVDKAVRLMLEDAKAHDARCNGEWEFLGDQGWAAFDCETDQQLQEAYSRSVSMCEIRVCGNRYAIDFDQLTQTNVTSRRTRRIRKRGTEATSSSNNPSSSSSPSGTALPAHECVRPMAPARGLAAQAECQEAASQSLDNAKSSPGR